MSAERGATFTFKVGKSLWHRGITSLQLATTAIRQTSLDRRQFSSQHGSRTCCTWRLMLGCAPVEQ